jgi:GTP-binding protein Era
VVDVTEPPGKGDEFVLDLVRGAPVPVFLILNKIDLVRKSTLLPLIDRFRTAAPFAEIVPLSAATGDNVERLERAVIDTLPEGERLYPEDFLTDQPERAFAAEIIREKLLQFTHAEIPFASAVIVERFEEPEATRTHPGKPVTPGPERPVIPENPENLLKIFASIVVDRASQKPIVVGRGGEMVKRIGTAAREELERFFATRVYLDLHVRVEAAWREDDRTLGRIGLSGHE